MYWNINLCDAVEVWLKPTRVIRRLELTVQGSRRTCTPGIDSSQIFRLLEGYSPRDCLVDILN